MENKAYKYTVYIYGRYEPSSILIKTYQTDDISEISLERMKEYSYLNENAYIDIRINTNE